MNYQYKWEYTVWRRLTYNYRKECANTKNVKMPILSIDSQYLVLWWQYSVVADYDNRRSSLALALSASHVSHYDILFNMFVNQEKLTQS